ncbi:uncharacterized protein LOC131150802 [Malania oleifera]|uniref:uncharacterized protein LOC131150802 n=1 Tax=Malania oleifera TaxID=397392 RepID=UPI0025AEB451|nr:uncharacterized protein LOC131150802 [Malania oleifera]XP_057957757.1 uncharacterized protein LOC131150802 [Malania oleifera]XP_057957758.1 uncharacterized protein LOC131150802 [Malania oleifera]
MAAIAAGVESQLSQHTPLSEDEFAKCHCCGLTEECTPEYIARVRERYQGRWICGLCAEAIEVEILRSEGMIGAEEALDRHINFCKQFESSSPPSRPTEDLISAVKQLLLRSLDSPRAVRSTPSSPPAKVCDTRPLLRSESCYSTLDG